MAIRTNSLLNKEKGFIIYLDFSICIVGGDISVPYNWIQQGAMCPVGCNGALEHAHLTGLEKLVFIIFLKTLDEIAVHFSSQDVLTSGFSFSWLRGNKKTKSIDSSERATARQYEEKMASKPYETSLALPIFQTISSPKRHS